MGKDGILYSHGARPGMRCPRRAEPWPAESPTCSSARTQVTMKPREDTRMPET